MRNIQQALEEHKAAVLERYPEDKLLGVFAYGSMNYGTYIKGISDVDTKAILIPSFSDLILREPISKEIHLANNEHCEVKDIRELVKMFKKQNINFLEILYTDYCWINPFYKEVWEDTFIKNRDKIVYYDVNKAIQSICGQAIHTIKQDPLNGKKISNGFRLYYFLADYTSGKPYRECIKQPQEKLDFLTELKLQESLPDSTKADELLTAFTQIKGLDVAMDDEAKHIHDIAETAMEIGLHRLIRLYDDFWSIHSNNRRML